MPGERAPGLAALLLLSVVLLLLRVPYLFSRHYVLDGDEAILGLMAWHAAQGLELPVFFWGQSYGFSLLEVLPAALAFRAVGLEPLALPLAMGALFLAALPFYASAFARLSGSAAWAWILTLVLGAQPVWIVWSLKARGGYLTAFVLLGIILWLVTRAPVSPAAWAAVGALAGLLALAQVLWLPAVIPLLGLGVSTRGSARSGRAWLGPVLALGVMVVVAVVVRAAWAPANAFWNPPVFQGVSLRRAFSVPPQLFRVFTGFFYLSGVHTPPLVVGLIAAVAVGLFVACAGGLVVEYARTRRRLPLLVAGAMGATFVPALGLQGLPPRYLLSSSVLLVVGLATWLGSRGVRLAGRPRVVVGAALLLLGLGAIEMRHFRFQGPGTGSDVQAQLRNLVRTLRASDVTAVYSQSGLLQWQIMLYSREAIAARSKSPVDRYPEYVRRVAAARAGGARTALVGGLGSAVPLPTPLGGRFVLVGTDYFMILDPTPELLRRRGFTLGD